MGFNPFRTRSKSGTDIALVVGFAALTASLVLWAFYG
jgi:hypothetical protein